MRLSDVKMRVMRALSRQTKGPSSEMTSSATLPCALLVSHIGARCRLGSVQPGRCILIHGLYE